MHIDPCKLLLYSHFNQVFLFYSQKYAYIGFKLFENVQCYNHV